MDTTTGFVSLWNSTFQLGWKSWLIIQGDFTRTIINYVNWQRKRPCTISEWYYWWLILPICWIKTSFPINQNAKLKGEEKSSPRKLKSQVSQWKIHGHREGSWLGQMPGICPHNHCSWVILTKLPLAILMEDTGAKISSPDGIVVASNWHHTCCIIREQQINCLSAWRRTLLSCSADTTVHQTSTHQGHVFWVAPQICTCPNLHLLQVWILEYQVQHSNWQLNCDVKKRAAVVCYTISSTNYTIPFHVPNTAVAHSYWVYTRLPPGFKKVAIFQNFPKIQISNI